MQITRPVIGDGQSLPQFYEQLSASVASGDLGFSFDRLHPAVFEAYSESECRAALATFTDPDLMIAFVSEGETGPWVWDVPDGPSIEVIDATAVTISLSGRGQTGQQAEAHIARVDGELRWFTFCS